MENVSLISISNFEANNGQTWMQFASANGIVRPRDYKVTKHMQRDSNEGMIG